MLSFTCRAVISILSGISGSPIVVAIAHSCAGRIRFEEIKSIVERFINVRVPPVLSQTGRTPERGAIGPHLREEPDRPDVVRVGIEHDSAGILLELLHVHHRGQPELFEVVEARGLLRLCFRLGQGGQQHSG